MKALLKSLYLLATLALVASCASVSKYNLPCVTNPDQDYKDVVTIVSKAECFSAEAFVNEPVTEAIKNIPEAKRKPVVAVYRFQDQTGQRKSIDGYASFSTALTQAPINYLIRALMQSNFFVVVERAAFEAITRERQIIRSGREKFNDDTKQLPLLFAGIIIEGDIVDYNTNLQTGGIGARYLGIGSSKQYREDTIVVSLRLISVSTGEILLETLTSKTILSVAVSNDVFRYIEDYTKLVEFETGSAMNESKSIAIQAALETAVVNIINLGIEKDFWEFNE
jgi:curli production assembly/transport component CsgG